MKTAAVIQARMGSDRLPGKILAPLNGVPLLAAVRDRLRRADVDEWWLATTDSPRDDVTSAWGEALGLEVYRGAEHDVLSRFVAIADRTSADIVIRITADNPFISSDVVDELVAQFRGAADTVDYMGAPEGQVPLGLVPEAVMKGTLHQLDASLPAGSHHRVHVLSKLTEDGHGGTFRVPADWPLKPAWRWTVDTPEDLQMAVAAFRLLGDDWRNLSYPETAGRLAAHANVMDINRHVAQKDPIEG